MHLKVFLKCTHYLVQKKINTCPQAHSQVMIFSEQMMQETAELKDRLERDRSELETHLRQQVNQQQERACDLDKQVRKIISIRILMMRVIYLRYR